MSAVAQFSCLTIALTVGLGAVISAAFRVNVGANWEERRCDPHVVPIAGFFKPTKDPRTAAQFATDNWSFCQKEYIQNALRVAADVPKAMAAEGAATVGVMQDIASAVADVFFDLWKFCYETYSAFMGKMKGVAKLFHNFMINLYSITERLNAAALSIIYGLIALIVTVVNSVQVTLIVAIVVIGIILALQIILFFVLMPISGLIITVTALVSVAVVSVTTAIAAAMVAEMFTPGACFAKNTPVQLASGATCPISKIRLNDTLRDGGRVTAVHKFRSFVTFYNLHGVRVTGDHLVAHPDEPRRRIYVSKHPEATVVEDSIWPYPVSATEVWCLTTTTRCIPCVGTDGVILFADWEEIPDDDVRGLTRWFRNVWHELNGAVSSPNVEKRVIESEAGLSPDCLIPCMDWAGRQYTRQLRDIGIGDIVYDSPTTTTVVVGKTAIVGDMATDAIEMPCGGGIQFVSCATWVKEEGGTLWRPAADVGVVREVHPVRWEHLYTQSGHFMIGGNHLVRDASDVGLTGLRPLVDSIVLG
jgi:hypothetical protein